MAGSYKHVITRNGNFKDNEALIESLETGGDVFETVEEMFGMIWYLASKNVGSFDAEGNVVAQKDKADRMKAWVEEARQNYRKGLGISQVAHRISPDTRRG
jgi:hypothetical protein